MKISRIIIFIGFTLLLSNNAYSHGAPKFTVDTSGMICKINDAAIDLKNVESVLGTIHNEYRKVEKKNKTLYIFDQSGFLIEKSEEGISFMVNFVPGENENEPKMSFSGKVFLNDTEISQISTIEDILDQLPKIKKLISNSGNLIYMGDKMFLSAMTRDNKLMQFDFGFKTN
ncbi:MAG: hypothetical protein H6605_00840 [Flavobacteriales bacterium]|nr:hypothetical protein [Flavobacteriales bacterium]